MIDQNKLNQIIFAEMLQWTSGPNTPCGWLEPLNTRDKRKLTTEYTSLENPKVLCILK